MSWVPSERLYLGMNLIEDQMETLRELPSVGTLCKALTKVQEECLEAALEIARVLQSGESVTKALQELGDVEVAIAALRDSFPAQGRLIDQAGAWKIAALREQFRGDV